MMLDLRASISFPKNVDRSIVELSGILIQGVRMKICRFSETQIITILKQAEGGIKIKDLCREHGISDAT